MKRRGMWERKIKGEGRRKVGVGGETERETHMQRYTQTGREEEAEHVCKSWW